MIIDKNLKPDGQLTTVSGMDSSKHPSDIQEDQIALGVNVINRGGHVGNRPQFLLPRRIQDITLDGLDQPVRFNTYSQCLTAFPDCRPVKQQYLIGGYYLTKYVPSFDYLPSGTWQGLAYYRNNLNSNKTCLWTVKDGEVYQILVFPSYITLRKVLIEGQTGMILDPDLPVNIIQAGPIAIFQDGANPPIFWTGTKLRRASYSDPNNPECPVGYYMAWDGVRLWVACDNKVYAGDIFKQSDIESIIRFSENIQLTGGAFTFPHKVTGLSFMPQSDSNTGYGSLLVTTTNDFHFINSQITKRADWQKTDPMQGLILANVNCATGHSMVPYAQDMFFRSMANDGFRTNRNARAQAGQLLNALNPISNEIVYWTDNESFPLVAGTCAVLWDRRFLATGDLQASGKGEMIAGSAILALDTAPTASIKSASTPAWDGGWYGLRVTRFAKGQFGDELVVPERLFALSADIDDDENPDVITPRLWEIGKKAGYDRENDWTTRTLPTQTVDTRSFNCGSDMVLKKMLCSQLDFVDIQGQVSIKIQYRTNHEINWIDWDEGVIGISDTIEPEFGKAPYNLTTAGKYRKLRTKSLSADDIDKVNQREQRQAYALQMRIIWQGIAKLSKVLLFAIEIEDNARGGTGNLQQ